MEDSRSKRVISTFHIAELRVVGEDTGHGAPVGVLTDRRKNEIRPSKQCLAYLMVCSIAYMLPHSFSRMA